MFIEHLGLHIKQRCWKKKDNVFVLKLETIDDYLESIAARVCGASI